MGGRWGLRLAPVLAAAALFAAGCGGGSSSSGSSPSAAKAKGGPSSITLVSQPNGAGLPLYVAQKHGFFKDVGLNVKIKYYAIGAAALAAGANNEWQAGWLGAPPALTGANQYGLIPVGIMIQEDGNHITFMTRKVLNGSSPAQVLQSHPVATAQNSLAEQVLDGCAKHFGVDPSKLQIVNLDPGAIVQALESGKVDVVNSWASPDYSLLKDNNYVQVCNGTLSGVHVLDPFVVTPKFAQDQPQAAAAYTAAVYHANQWINDHHAQAVKDMLEIYNQNGITGSKGMADYEIRIRHWYSLQEALAAIQDGSTAKGLKASAQFFVDKGVYPQMPPIDDLLGSGVKILQQAAKIKVGAGA